MIKNQIEKFFHNNTPKTSWGISKQNFCWKTDDSDDLIWKIITPSNITDIYTRLEVLLGLKLSGHTDILTEASNLIDEIYEGVEIQNDNNIERFLTNFLPGNWNFPVNY